MDTFKTIIDKVSQYNFITNILPGTILCIVLKYLVGYDIIVDEPYLNGFIFYFIGMINNRIGSLFIEPLCKWIHIVEFARYSDYIDAEKSDAKLSVLNMENNAFRSYISLSFITLTAFLYRDYISIWVFIHCHRELVILCILLLVFVLSYRKQTSFIRKRVEKYVKERRNEF